MSVFSSSLPRSLVCLLVCLSSLGCDSEGDGAADAVTDAAVVADGATDDAAQADAAVADAALPDGAVDAEIVDAEVADAAWDPDQAVELPDAAPDAEWPDAAPDLGPPVVFEVEEPDSREMPTLLEFRNGVARALYAVEVEGDVDWFQFTLESPVSVAIGAANPEDSSACVDDALIELYRFDDAEALVTDDDDGPGYCPLLAPDLDDAMHALPAGDYLIAARSFNGTVTGTNLMTVAIVTPLSLGDPCTDTLRTCPAGTVCVDVCVENRCGDGVVAGEEACDDGNDLLGDGCDLCEIVPIALGAPCNPGTPQFGCVEGAFCSDAFVCEASVCGDGIVTGDETCDDQNDDVTDGCVECQLGGLPVGEACDPLDGTIACAEGAFCAFATRRCQAHVCGDGTLAPDEPCDDGNDREGDGCEACQIVPIALGAPCRPGRFPCEADAYCHPEQTVCVEAACGDGVVTGDEQCDDGNELAGDGCDVTCRYSPYADEPNGIDAPYALAFENSISRVIFDLDEGDEDWFLLDLEAPSNVWLEITDLPGNGCNGDPQFTLYAEDLETEIIFGNDGGIGLCPQVGAALREALSPLPAGRWYLRVTGAPVEASWLTVRAEALVAVDGPCASRLGYSECVVGAACAPSGTCQIPVCGDGEAIGDEQCDDGNDDDLDGCTSACEIADVGLGRVCRPGFQNCVDEAYCRVEAPEEVGECVEHECGDGRVGPLERCDDGNDNDNDGCNSECEFSPVNVEPDGRDNPTRVELDEEGTFRILFEIDPAGDQDWFELRTERPVRFSARTVALVGDDCSGDTFLELFHDEDAEPITGDDDRGPGLCSWIDPGRDATAAELPAGRWLIRARQYYRDRTAGGNWLIIETTPL